ncbi:MAG TPA: hypothetical protein VNM67_07380 [Thermoanaerobaculia bacterium]|jgi:hypothetical protein|nr:hypothetical protein [Thermoanaerobaculia bacterium]
MPPRRLSRDDLPLLAVLAAALLLWAWVCAPVIAGTRTFFVRDVFTTHVPYKAFGAEQLREGRIPAYNPTWGLGQPFRGNPNALPFYPGNVLYLVLPFWSAFGAHYALHWLIALAAMYALARGLGLEKPAALLAGITYAGSGWMLSTMTFYNLLTVAAWWPLVLLGAVWGGKSEGGRRGIALGGIACGLALLGGEPVTAAIGLIPLLVIAIQHLGWKRGFLTAVAIGAVGVLIALPQVVALLRVLPFTYRGAHGMSAEQAAHFTLHPLRLVELLVPFPFGWPTWLGRYGIWAVAIFKHTPLFLTLYFGIVGLALALPGSRSRPAWAGLAVAGLALAVLGGISGDLLKSLSFGLFRYPEKFLFCTALALPLLAGEGLERVLAGGRRWMRIAGVTGLLLVLGGVAVRIVAPSLFAGAGFERLGGAQDAAQEMLSTQISSWNLALLAAGAALLATAWAVSWNQRRKARWSAALIVAAQLALLTQLWPLLMTDSTAPYKEPAPWARRLGEGAAVLNTVLASPPWSPNPPYTLQSGTRIPLERATALDLDSAPGVLHGLTYPFAPDLEGLQSPLFSLMLYNLPRLKGPQRVNWLRVLGLDALVLFEDVDIPGLKLEDRATRFGVESRLYRVEAPAPRAWWPDEVRLAKSPPAALWAVSNMPDPIASVVVSEPVEHKPGGRVRLLSEEPDRIELEVEGPGGLAIVRRAWQPLFEARTGDRELRTVLVDLNLMGIVVPAGKHRVVLEVSAWPEILAGVMAVLVLVGAFFGLRRTV